MFCTNCGKEIADDSRLCGYCGAPVETETGMQYQEDAGVEQQGRGAQGTPAGQQGCAGQGNFVGQQNFQGVGGYPQNYVGPQGYNANAQNRYKPDNKFNVWAFLFGGLWFLFHGMWDVFLASIVYGILLLLVNVIPVVGQIVSLVMSVACLVIMGRTANYYYRLKDQSNIPTYKAIMDPNLRRL